MLKLVSPNISHKEQWEEIMEEWWDNWRKNPRIFFQDTYDTFLEMLTKVENADDTYNKIPKSNCYFLCLDKKIVWMYVFRHNLNFWDDAVSGWHIGYGIRPSERKKWYGKEWLRLVLNEAKSLWFLSIFISCDDDNTGSVKIIEANGWILEKICLRHEVKTRRYEIDLYVSEKKFLQSLELELLQFETRHNPARLDELLADDFFECGASGDIFGKKECIKSLPQETKEKTIEYREMTVHILSETLAQIRWKAKITHPWNPPKCSFRSSLWRKSENGWQMFFHQGTLME